MIANMQNILFAVINFSEYTIQLFANKIIFIYYIIIWVIEMF